MGLHAGVYPVCEVRFVCFSVNRPNTVILGIGDARWLRRSPSECVKVQFTYISRENTMQRLSSLSFIISLVVFATLFMFLMIVIVEVLGTSAWIVVYLICI